MTLHSQGFAAALSEYLPTFLCLYWTLAAGAAIFALLPLDLAPRFRSAVQLSAARGKLCDSSSQTQIGWLTNVTVPQQWFLHFYVAGTACNSVLVYTHVAKRGGCPGCSSQQQAISLASLMLLEVHLVRRMLETACIMSYPKDAKMHLIAYVFGISYYVVLPLSCIPMATFADWQTPVKTLESVSPQSALAWLAMNCPRLQMGACLFLAGNALQCWSHCILANLCKGTPQKAIKQEDFYQIPQGGPFRWISCPHYLGEIVIYSGLALLAGQTMPLTLVILCWVVANLLLAAQPTHQWYQQHFPDYPQHRTALIPYLY